MTKIATRQLGKDGLSVSAIGLGGKQTGRVGSRGEDFVAARRLR